MAEAEGKRRGRTRATQGQAGQAKGFHFSSDSAMKLSRSPNPN